MSAPCSVRKDKSGVFQKIKALVFSDKITPIVCSAMFALLCIGPMIFFGINGGLYYIVGKYNEWNSEMLLILQGICVVFSFTAGILTTQYLSKRESAEYHSKLPIGMRKILLVKIVSNMLICICTIIISLVIVYLLSFIFPSRLTTWGNFRAMLALAKVYIPCFIMYFALGVWIGTLCGGLYTKVLYFIIIILSIASTVAIFNGSIEKELIGVEFYKLVPYSYLLNEKFGSINYATHKIFDDNLIPDNRLIVFMLSLSIVFLALSVYLVKYRRTEYAEYSFNSTISARIFRAVAVFASYCVIFLKMDEGRLIIIEEHPIYSEGGDIQILLDMEYTMRFNFILPLLLLGIFLMFSYPLKNRKKFLCAYDYFPILLFFIIFEYVILKKLQ